MSCGVAIMKFTLIFFNVIFLLIGVAGVALGIWIAVDPSTLFSVLNVQPDAPNNLIQVSSYIFIAGCAFILIVAALGIFGACTSNKCLLGFYGFFVILIFAIELAALITIIVYDQKFRTELKDELTKQVKTNYPDGSKPFTQYLDKFMREFQCCGINNATDFDGLNISNDRKIGGYPKSCHPSDTSAASDRYTDGCYGKIRGLITTFGGIIIGIVVAVLVFEIILFTFAMCLCRHDEFGDKIV